jgi:hypothetical protein
MGRIKKEEQIKISVVRAFIAFASEQVKFVWKHESMDRM